MCAASAGWHPLPTLLRWCSCNFWHSRLVVAAHDPGWLSRTRLASCYKKSRRLSLMWPRPKHPHLRARRAVFILGCHAPCCTSGCGGESTGGDDGLPEGVFTAGLERRARRRRRAARQAYGGAGRLLRLPVWARRSSLSSFWDDVILTADDISISSWSRGHAEKTRPVSAKQGTCCAVFQPI